MEESSGRNKKRCRTTLTESCSSVSSCTMLEGKYSKIKSLIEAINAYLETWSEDTALTINRHLQALSYTIDISLFDPHKNVTAHFFASLYDLMNKLEPRNQMAWYCVDVLINACKNSSARSELIHTYSFLHPLSRLISDQLSAEKKVRLLKLMQDLTCGINISWQIPHLSRLMQTLTKWIETQSEEIVTLSLGVLVNLCYKNVPAIYALSRCVDIKEFLKSCMPLQGPIIIEVYVCKLMLIVEHICGDVPTKTLQNLINPMFRSILDAYNTKDVIILRQIIEFYTDMMNNKTANNPLISHDKYKENLSELLEVLDSNEAKPANSQDSECVSLILNLMHCLLENKIPSIVSLYPEIMDFALKWIQSKEASYEALAVLKTMSINISDKESSILEKLRVGLPGFLVGLNGKKDSVLSNEYCKRVGALLQLLRVMTQVESMCQNVLEEIKEDMLTNIFIPLLGDETDQLNAGDIGVEATNLYVYALSLIVELAKHDASWVPLQNNLINNRRIHLLLAQSFYNSPKNVRVLALEISSNPRFPRESIAEAMESIQPTVICKSAQKAPSPSVNIATSPLNYPMLTVSQINNLNGILTRLKRLMEENNVNNITTNEVLELYEYKCATMGKAEKVALASLEAETERCVHLQHRLAQLTAEQNKLHQLLYQAQQKQEDSNRKCASFLHEFRELNNKLEAEKGKYKACDAQLKLMEKQLIDREHNLEETKEKLKNMTASKNSLQEQCDKLKQLVNRLEENNIKLEKKLEKHDEMLKKANLNNESLKSQVHELEVNLKQNMAKLEEVQMQLQQKSQILETITKMANSSQTFF